MKIGEKIKNTRSKSKRKVTAGQDRDKSSKRQCDRDK